MALLRADRARAAESGDPMANLCVLATVHGREPEARMLVLRDLEPVSGEAAPFGLFMNGNSPKFREIQNSATVAIVVYLPSLAVQYRMRCALEPLPARLVHDSWRLRPAIPKRMDWLYEKHPQSTSVASRRRLLDLLDGPDPEIAPDSAIGFRLAAKVVERLDLNAPDGVHDRRRYCLDGARWMEQVLVP